MTRQRVAKRQTESFFFFFLMKIQKLTRMRYVPICTTEMQIDENHKTITLWQSKCSSRA